MSGNAENTRNGLIVPAPTISTEYAGDVAHRYYGIQGKARELTCESDRLLLLDDARGQRYILRFINHAEPHRVSDFHTQALLHVAQADPDLPVPRVVPARNGAAHITVPAEDGRTCVVRLITCMPGAEISALAARSPELYLDMGSKLARLDLALSGFSHPAAKFDLIWDLEQADRVRDLLSYIQSDELRELAAAALDGYRENVLPVLPRLRRQVIHNDFNPDNVMVDGKNPDRVAGIIDFGDTIQSPIINEAAIALYYNIDYKPALFRQSGLLLRSYHQTLPLEANELNILYDLMLARGALSTTILEWRIAEFRKQGRYMFRNHGFKETGLYRLAKLGREKVQNMLFEHCNF